MIAADAALPWIGGLLAIMTLSALWADNPACKLAEHLFVGVSAAYWMSVAFWSTIVPNLLGRIYPPLLGALLPSVPEAPADLTLLAPLALGVLLVAPLPPRARALRRIPIAFAVAYAAGAAIPRYLLADFVAQIEAAAAPIAAGAAGAIDMRASADNAAGAAATLAALSASFLFPGEGRCARAVRRAGRAAITAAFGVGLGHMIVSRASILAGAADAVVTFVRERF